MKVWRIRLKGTDLFYQPTKGRWSGERSNIGENGKVYVARKPSLKSIGMVNVSQSVAIKHGLKHTGGRDWFLADGYEWEIVEYDCVEVKEQA